MPVPPRTTTATTTMATAAMVAGAVMVTITVAPFPPSRSGDRLSRYLPSEVRPRRNFLAWWSTQSPFDTLFLPPLQLGKTWRRRVRSSPQRVRLPPFRSLVCPPTLSAAPSLTLTVPPPWSG